MKKIITFLIVFCTVQAAVAQQKLPVIKATSTSASIKADNILYKNSWIIVPEEKPDVYTTSAKKVTFYTDLDSISFSIEIGGIYDFIILLDETDSAYTQIQYTPSRLDMLKAAKDYNYNDLRFIPEFTYQLQSDTNLVRIRQKFNLDSIAGNGNEISQIFNLLHWVHKVVRHDGNSYNPEPRNIENIITVCREENRGVNCRMMATMLNECYLALGIKSRFVTCMPKETDFDDCHVINMVFSNDLQKWIWIDPTFDAYVTDENDNLLGIEEVRERLINDKPLKLNPDANWNGEQPKLKEDYLDQYMAKNLYRMQVMADSKYDAETDKTGIQRIYVELLPLDGINQEPQKSEHKYKGEVRTIYYKTNNPELFWTKP